MKAKKESLATRFRIDRRQRKIQTAKEAMETSEGDGSGSLPGDEERKKIDLGGGG